MTDPAPLRPARPFVSLRSLSATIRASGLPSARMGKSGRIKGMRDLLNDGVRVSGIEVDYRTGKPRAALVEYAFRAGYYAPSEERRLAGHAAIEALRVKLAERGYLVRVDGTYALTVSLPLEVEA